MPRLRSIQTNFTSGELDPQMRFRTDTGAYRNGAETLKNALLYSTGGAARRPGSEHKASLAARKTRIIPFDFANDERYVLALSDQRLDVFDSGGGFLQTISSGINWTESDLFELVYSQKADVCIITHRNWKPQQIVRTSATTFEVIDFEFRTSSNLEKSYQPFFKFADNSITLSCSATSGTGVTITASDDVFTSDYVGTLLRWWGTEIEVTAYTSATVVTGTIYGTLQGELLENPFAVTNGSAVVTVTHVAHGFATGASVTLSGAADTAGITAAQLNGAKTITVLNDNEYTFVAAASATDSLDGGGPNVKFTGANLPTRNWDEQTFSTVNGWPGACVFHEGRLWLAGSGGIPDGLWSSKIFDFYNFDVGEGAADDSIQITLGADDISNIRHIVSNGDLQIFTATAEFYAVAPRNAALTTATIVVRRQTPYGASFVRPEIFDGATVFMQEANTGLREFLYNEATQRYAATNLNVLSSHLIETPTDMAVLRGTLTRSEQYAFLVMEEGTMAVFHSSRAEELAAWVPWELGGDGDPKFISVCTLGQDVWVVVLRDSVYRLEKLYDTIDNPIDGVTYYSDTVAKTSWVVDPIHYDTTVAVRSGPYYIGEYPVDSSGNIEIDTAVKSIAVGYGYEFKIVTLPVDIELNTGSMVGLPKRISRVFIGLLDTYAVKVGGPRLVIRNTYDDLGLVPAPKTGTQEFYLLGYSKDAQITIDQTTYQPVTVLGLNMEVSF